MGIRDKEWARHSGSVFYIPWSRIKLSEFGNQRTEFPDESIAMRANSLILEGQKTAIEGYLSDDGEWFEFIDGEIRYRAWYYAMKHLGVDLHDKLGGMKCVVVKKPSSKADAMFYQISRGSDTVPISQMDKANAIMKLYSVEEVPVSEIAKRLFCSEQHIRDMIKLTAIAPELKQAIKEGAIKPTAALKVAKARIEAQEEVKEKLERGEQVKGSDVDIADGKLKVLSVEEIQKQLKIADKNFCTAKTEKERLSWQSMCRAFRICIGLDEKL